jgi:hypothetical protein
MSSESESTGRDRRTFSYVTGPMILRMYVFTPPSRYGVTWNENPRPSILVHVPREMIPSMVHL